MNRWGKDDIRICSSILGGLSWLLSASLWVWAVPYFPTAYPEELTVFAAVGLLVSVLAACAAAVGGLALFVCDESLTLPAVWRRRYRLERRLKKVTQTARRVEPVLNQLPAGNVHHTTLQLHHDRLKEAAEVLKIELTYAELEDLEKQTSKVVRREMSSAKAIKGEIQ